MTTTITSTRSPRAAGTRYASTEQHDISRCERGLSPILGAKCRCGGKLFGAKRGDGPEFFEPLPTDDPHSFKTLPSREIRLMKVRR
jgi:hypothetical protein